MSSVLEDYLLVLNPAKCGSSWLAHGLTISPFMSFPREFDFLYFLGFPLENQWNAETAEDKEFLAVRADNSMSPDAKLVRLYEIERTRRQKIGMLVDKAPSNIHCFLRFRNLFRNTKTVILYRDPRDVYISNELYLQRQLHKVEQHDDVGSLDYLGQSTVFEASIKSCEKVLAAERQLEEDGVDFLKITYEGMKQDFVGVLSRVIEFSGVEVADDAPVSSHYVEQPIPFSEHIRRAREFKPLFRKGIVGDWKNHITTAEAKTFVKERCGDLLVALGYEDGKDW